MIHHISIRTSDCERSRKFFAAVLAPLGYGLSFERGISGAGFGNSGAARWRVDRG